MDCLILAAGRNSRLDTGIPKSLVTVGDESLLSRHIRIFKKFGVHRFCIVSGYQAETIEAQLDTLRALHNVDIVRKHNDRWDLENGFSVSKSREWIEELSIQDFFMTMGDHIFQEDFVQSFINKSSALESDLQLAVDIPGKTNDHIDIDDVTKVDVDSDWRIRSIGKGITAYNHYDTGLFRLKAKVLDVLEDCFSQDRFTISDMVTDLISTGQARATLVPGYTWNDVDNRLDLDGTLKLISEGRL
ncbi:MAG: NTP transferase domain-containing protein [Cyclobacteriaceae bacterium]